MLALLVITGMANAQISSCKDENIDQLRICSHGEYDKAVGHPVPIYLKEKIWIYDIAEFNQNDKTITVFMGLKLFWNDTRLMLKSNQLLQKKGKRTENG